MPDVKLIRHSGSWVHYPAPWDDADEITIDTEAFYSRLAKKEHGPGPAAEDWAPRRRHLLTFKKITTPGFFGGTAYFEAREP